VTELQLAHTPKPSLSQLEKYAVFAQLAGQTRKSQLAQQQAEQLATTGKTGKAAKNAKQTVDQAIAVAVAEFSPQGASKTTTPSTLPSG
jgi:hypothetical protein